MLFVKTYTCLEKEGQFTVVKKGFNFPAFFFLFFWAFCEDLNLKGIISLLIAFFLFLINPDLIFLLQILFGFMGNDWVVSKWEKKGFTSTMEIRAKNKQQAIQEVLKKYKGVLGKYIAIQS
ncbi:MAG: hypothetical protein EBR01_14015 [Proteobacteria bacterium]|nr:hypothetical protein [Pseudomonadota bacterium]